MIGSGPVCPQASCPAPGAPPVLLSSLIQAPAGELAGALAAGDEGPRRCLRDWLAQAPYPRSPPGRWHLLEYVLPLAD
jgi:hypothetical protein